MKLKRTKNLSPSVIADAFPYFSGSHNSQTACGYAFTKDKRGREVYSGEFFYASEGEPTFERFDGFFDFNSRTLQDLETGETLQGVDFEPYALKLNRSPAWMQTA